MLPSILLISEVEGVEKMNENTFTFLLPPVEVAGSWKCSEYTC